MIKNVWLIVYLLVIIMTNALVTVLSGSMSVGLVASGCSVLAAVSATLYTRYSYEEEE